MLRVPQHERKKINEINSSPFVLSAVEGLLRVFQQPASALKGSLLAHNLFHQSDHLGGLDHDFFG